jgi:uncharacterized protein YbjT (DUF2867 family)
MRRSRKEKEMKIVVIGGTGLIGSKLVEKLHSAGHHAVAAAPATGVDTLTGEGLTEVLDDAQVVVDVADPPDWKDAAAFFQTSSRNLLAAEIAAGVEHHVVLSVVGSDRLSGSAYLRAKVAQEEAVCASTVPSTILRAAQFFEFISRIADSHMNGDSVYLPPVFIQPESADDVAAALAEIALCEPVNGIVELAGPDEFRLDELVRRIFSANSDLRRVTVDINAPYFGTQLDYFSLTPGGHARIAPTHFEDWLSWSTAIPHG